MKTLTHVPLGEIKALVDLLAELDVSVLHLHIDTRDMLDKRARINLWISSRTDYFRLCDHLKLTPTEKRYQGLGQREWWAEADTPARALLIQCVSFEHHDDWEPRAGKPASTGDLLDLIDEEEP